MNDTYPRTGQRAAISFPLGLTNAGLRVGGGEAAAMLVEAI